MLSLSELLAEHGSPDILIDSFSKSSKKYAAWGLQEIFEINTQGCFLNGKSIPGDPLQEFQNILNKWKTYNTDSDIACIGFISYEFKKFIYKHINFNDSKSSNFPYVWFCRPQKIYEYSINNHQINTTGKLHLLKDIMDFDDYNQFISDIKMFLKAGDAYQINFTDYKTFKSNFRNSFDLYQSLSQKAKPIEGFFLHTNNFDILSFSPESFIKIENGIISTKPIKGTRPRSKNRSKDNILKNELQISIKDKAEHLMIIDLLRNDLGKICEPKTIEVNNLYNIESFKTIHHMVTKIQGKLSKNISEIDIIKALFPGGSITGAPKESAMKIIDKLENYNRKIYTGSAGYIKSNGDMSFNICIRTLLKIDDKYEYGVGGGIVWDSIAKDEWKEAHQKSKILD